MQAKLRVLRGSSAGTEVRLKGPKFLIGRSEECQMRARSDAISRRHCAVLVRQSGIAVRDLGSRNGTFVNGQRIDGDHTLSDGDHLQVGPLEFTVLIQVTEAAKASMTAARPEPEQVGDLVNRWLEELDEGEPAELTAVSDKGDTGRFYTDDTDAVVIDPTGDVSTHPNDETKIVGSAGNPQSAAEGKAADGKAANAAAVDAEQAAPDSPPGKPKPKATKPGKLPKREQGADAPKNTQEAAAQMLRRMMNRR